MLGTLKNDVYAKEYLIAKEYQGTLRYAKECQRTTWKANHGTLRNTVDAREYPIAKEH